MLLRFASPGAAETLAEAQRLASEIDPTFLWEATGDGEFGFDDLAREYYGTAPQPAQAAAVALLLSSSPMHFYRKGKGRYRKAPPDALKAALASVERKKREAVQADEWTAELAAHRLPAALRAKLSMLLYRPDKNALEWKALARACETQKTNPVDLLAACGAIPSTHEFHYNRFLARSVPCRRRVPAALDADRRAVAARGERARVLDRRRDDDRDRRRLLGDAARERQRQDRHPHRSSCAAHCRAAGRIDARRARACRPSTCRDAS